MVNLTKLLNKPEYIRQPRASLRRVFSPQSIGTSSTKIVKLLWNLELEVNVAEAIGRTISHHGLFEVAVVEAIFRLTDAADIFLDVGANIGFMSAAAISAGARKVIALEPHPELFRRLSRNLGMWIQARPEIKHHVDVRQVALSESEGKATLKIPKVDFALNQGISSLEETKNRSGYVGVEVFTTTLDRVIEGCGPSVGVLKIDIEGHEFKALSAGQTPLAAGKVRDIIFEDHEGIRSEVSRLLSTLGYSIFGLNKAISGPVLLGEESLRRRTRSADTLNFLATRDPERAKRRMSGRGYKCLRGHS